MDFPRLQLWFDVAQFLLTGAVGVYVYLSNRHHVTHERIGSIEQAVDERLDDHGARLAKLEAHLEHVPGKDDIGEVREMIARVGGDVKGVKAEVQGVRDVLKPMQRTIDLVNEFLLKNNR